MTSRPAAPRLPEWGGVAAWTEEEIERARRAQRLAAANNPRYDWSRPRGVRRVLAGAFVALLVAGVWFMGLAPDAPPYGGLLLAAAGTVLGLLRMQATRGLMWLRHEELDERQRTVRDRAHRFGYRVAVGALGTGVLLLLLGGTAGGFPTAETVGVVLVALLWLTVAAPVLLVAWTEPDDPEEQVRPGS
jgi:hypothetical protein